jgi:hypothetical protein
MIELAKPALDVGLYTNSRDQSLAFWGNQARLAYSELLAVGKGVQQHRHRIGQSVLKINHSREPLIAAKPGGIRAITLHTSLHIKGDEVNEEELQRLEDPDGNVVFLPRAGERVPDRLTVHLTVSDLQQHLNF